MATATIGFLKFTQIAGTSTCSVTRNGNPSGSIVIPNLVTLNDDFTYQVTSIGGQAFFTCSSLTSVTIPDSVTSIGTSSFYDCSGLTSVTIGTGVTNIGNSAFLYCSRLTSITIPNSVTNIGDSAFAYCSRLTSVTIGTGVTSISNSAFFDVPSSIKMYFLGSTIPTLTYIFGRDWMFNRTTQKGTAYYVYNVDPTINTANTNKLTTYFTTLNISYPAICFVPGSKILTDVGYKKIESLRKGDKVKTLKDGYKEIKMIGKMSFINDVSSGNPANCTYKLSKEQYEPNLPLSLKTWNPFEPSRYLSELFFLDNPLVLY
jgi:hypothetical protein